MISKQGAESILSSPHFSSQGSLYMPLSISEEDYVTLNGEEEKVLTRTHIRPMTCFCCVLIFCSCGTMLILKEVAEM